MAKTNNEALHVAFFIVMPTCVSDLGEHYSDRPVSRLSHGMVCNCFKIFSYVCNAVKNAQKRHLWRNKLCVNRQSFKQTLKHLAMLVFLLGFLLVREAAQTPPFACFFFCTELLEKNSQPEVKWTEPCSRLTTRWTVSLSCLWSG